MRPYRKLPDGPGASGCRGRARRPRAGSLRPGQDSNRVRAGVCAYASRFPDNYALSRAWSRRGRCWTSLRAWAWQRNPSNPKPVSDGVGRSRPSKCILVDNLGKPWRILDLLCKSVMRRTSILRKSLIIKNGGERGIRTPGTAFDRTTV